MDQLYIGIDAAGGSTKRPPPIRLPPVKSEYPLTEERKKYIEDVWKVLTMAGIDCIFDDVLPPDDQYKTTTTPLDSVPLLKEGSGVTASEVQTSERLRAQLTAANTAKEQLRDRLLTDYKAALGVAMLDAFEAKAPLTRKRMMKDHELVAATSSRPAKYDGCAIFTAYKNETNPNDATRQDADAEALHAELSLALPANVSTH